MARACLRRRDELDLFVSHEVNGAGQPWGESRSTWRSEIRHKMQAHQNVTACLPGVIESDR